MEKTILTDALGSCPSLKGLVAAILRTDTYIRWGPGVKFCVSDFRQSQEWRWKTGRILAWIP